MGTKESGNTPADPTRSLKYFTAFSCGAVDAPGTDLQRCFKYQLKEDGAFWADDLTEEQADGNPRFERASRVEYYMISEIGFKQEYSLIKGQIILTGSRCLAAGLALAATVSSMVF